MPYQKGHGHSVVVALGGNALGDDPATQLALAEQTAKHIVDMVEDGTNVVVTHGNGPQVGMISDAFNSGGGRQGEQPPMPFPEAGAMSQGYIGYHLSQALLNEVKRRGIQRSTACIVTQTVVDPADPAFEDLTKPIGPFVTAAQAEDLARENGWQFVEDSGRGWRRVVASPSPRRIVEFDAIADLVEDGYLVVAVGGGGIPVVEDEQGVYTGIAAVIDKDRSSARLAADMGADMLVILTAVEKVCLNFGASDQRELSSMTVEEAQRYMDQGQFAPGSMLPKVQACVDYLGANPGGRAVITSLDCAAEGLRGQAGTVITA